MLAKHVYPKTMTIKLDAHTNPYIPRVNRLLTHFAHKRKNTLKSSQYSNSESLLIHPKILTRKNESVLIHLRFKIGIAIFSVI